MNDATIISICISVATLVIALYFNTSTKRHTEEIDTKKETTDMTTVIVKLENISTGVSEIKADLRSLKSDVQANRERIVMLETNLKNLQHQFERQQEATDYDES